MSRFRSSIWNTLIYGVGDSNNCEELALVRLLAYCAVCRVQAGSGQRCCVWTSSRMARPPTTTVAGIDSSSAVSAILVRSAIVQSNQLTPLAAVGSIVPVPNGWRNGS